MAPIWITSLDAQVMVCAGLGISQCEFTNGAACIASRLATLRSDRKEIFRAAADVQRIADYLLAFHPDYAARHQGTMITAEDPLVAPGELQGPPQRCCLIRVVAQ